MAGNTTYRVSELNPSVLAAVNEELSLREEQQKKHYAFLQDLQSMAREVPSKYQQRLTNDILSRLASGLLDGTVFSIVGELSDLQRMEEESLFNERNRLIDSYAEKKRAMESRHRQRLEEAREELLERIRSECQQELEAFDRHRREEIIAHDKTVIQNLDDQVYTQQLTLMKANVAGFYNTADPDEIRLQMILLEFISRLSAAHFASQQ